MADTTIEQIEETFLTIDRDYEMLWGRTTNDVERKELRSARDAARDAFWAGAAKKLEDNNPFVVKLKESLKLANATLKQEIEAMESFTKIIKSINEAVKIAAAIVTLAAV